MTSQGEAAGIAVPEPVLEPEIPICDAHHHFWASRPDAAKYAEAVHWQERYLVPDLAKDIGGHNVRSTVFIEVASEYRAGGPEEMRPVGEVEFVQGLADESDGGSHGPLRAAAAIIGHADLKLGDGVRPVLETMRQASPYRFRGVRHSVGWDPSPELANREAQGMLSHDSYRAGTRVLASMGLCLENSLYFPQLQELAEFATAVPDLTIVLNHVGGLVRIGPYADRDDEVIPAWQRGVRAAAECPNIVMKLGGLGQARYGFDWHLRREPVGSEELAASLHPFMSYCIEQFGPDRCMFESNFPVDKVSYSYNVAYNAFKRLSREYSASERAAMFHDVAARVYGLGPTGPEA